VIYQHPLGYLLGLPAGPALDAACGTGRHARHLAELGHTVLGVDASAGMLAAARTNVPSGDFRQGDLTQLPVPGQPSDIWTLRPWCPAAFRAAYSGSPLMIFWKFQQAES
jgi:ubiquinone/menaquinone biosynthesis C-methylase UbiE